MRRGDIRLALLGALVDGPAHGYELIRRLEARTGGAWRPSPGSVYPTLQMLEDEGALRSRDEEGKKVYDLTDEGRQEAEAGRSRMADADAGPHMALRHAVQSLMMATRQVAVAGDQSQIEQATAIVTEARQKLYRMLAGD